MLTRRNAILSTAFALGASAKPAKANTLPAGVWTPQVVAHQCHELSSTIGQFLHSSNSSSQCDAALDVFVNAKDISFVAARMLRRDGSGPFAICQACADACDRLAENLKSSRGGTMESRCFTLARRCATACRGFMGDSGSSGN